MFSYQLFLSWILGLIHLVLYCTIAYHGNLPHRRSCPGPRNLSSHRLKEMGEADPTWLELFNFPGAICSWAGSMCTFQHPGDGFRHRHVSCFSSWLFPIPWVFLGVTLHCRGGVFCEVTALVQCGHLVSPARRYLATVFCFPTTK